MCVSWKQVVAFSFTVLAFLFIFPTIPSLTNPYRHASEYWFYQLDNLTAFVETRIRQADPEKYHFCVTVTAASDAIAFTANRSSSIVECLFALHYHSYPSTSNQLVPFVSYGCHNKTSYFVDRAWYGEFRFNESDESASEAARLAISHDPLDNGSFGDYTLISTSVTSAQITSKDYCLYSLPDFLRLSAEANVQLRHMIQQLLFYYLTRGRIGWTLGFLAIYGGFVLFYKAYKSPLWYVNCMFLFGLVLFYAFLSALCGILLYFPLFHLLWIIFGITFRKPSLVPAQVKVEKLESVKETFEATGSDSFKDALRDERDFFPDDAPAFGQDFSRIREEEIDRQLDDALDEAEGRMYQALGSRFDAGANAVLDPSTEFANLVSSQQIGQYLIDRGIPLWADEMDDDDDDRRSFLYESKRKPAVRYRRMVSHFENLISLRTVANTVSSAQHALPVDAIPSTHPHYCYVSGKLVQAESPAELLQKLCAAVVETTNASKQVIETVKTKSAKKQEIAPETDEVKTVPVSQPVAQFESVLTAAVPSQRPLFVTLHTHLATTWCQGSVISYTQDTTNAQIMALFRVPLHYKSDNCFTKLFGPGLRIADNNAHVMKATIATDCPLDITFVMAGRRISVRSGKHVVLQPATDSAFFYVPIPRTPETVAALVTHQTPMAKPKIPSSSQPPIVIFSASNFDGKASALAYTPGSLVIDPTTKDPLRFKFGTVVDCYAHTTSVAVDLSDKKNNSGPGSSGAYMYAITQLGNGTPVSHFLGWHSGSVSIDDAIVHNYVVPRPQSFPDAVKKLIPSA